MTYLSHHLKGLFGFWLWVVLVGLLTVSMAGCGIWDRNEGANSRTLV